MIVFSRCAARRDGAGVVPRAQSGEMATEVAKFEGYPVDANAFGYTSDVAAAVDGASGVLFFLQANQSAPLEYIVVAVKAKTGNKTRTRVR